MSLKKFHLCGHVEGYVHGRGSAHAQEGPKNAVISDHLLTVMLCTNGN